MNRLLLPVLAHLTLPWLGACTGSMVTSRPIETITPQSARGSLVYALPKTRVTLTVAKGGAGGSEPKDVKLTPTTVADPAQVYVLDYTPSPLASDTLEVGIAGRDNPTLKTLNATAEDQTAAILIAAARSAARLSALQFAEEIVFTREFDPHDRQEMADLRAELNAKFNLDIRCIPECPLPTPRAAAAAPGLFMRALVPVQLAVCRGSCDTATGPEQVVSIPSYNASPIFRFPVPRTAFVKRETSFVIQPVDLTTLKPVDMIVIKLTKPSEALAIAGTPGAVIGAMFKGLSDAATDRRTLLTSEVALVTAQTNLMTAQLAQWDAEKLLRAAQEQAAAGGQP